ncbi:MAG: transcriptional regulator [Planctomycetes bacterium]|nr:transcriptional regulator [Planctomycetota bacterium]MCB9903948.1 transcriptional regulator [Planctomycetota bacterium]
MAAERKAKRSLQHVPGLAISGTPLDKLVHEPLRLAILTTLSVNASMAFTELRDALQATDGNVSVHSRKLEEAGYISCKKGFDGRTPRTTFKITAKGRRALGEYLDHMEALIRATRGE